MESSYVNFYVILCLIILLPIIPAFLFYKIIPSKKTDVSGTFAGLTFKLGGAFGGYFLMVFFLVFSFNSKIESPNSYEVWLIEAQVEFVDGEGSTSQLKTFLDPPTRQSFDNKIKLKVLKEPGHDGGKVFPIIRLMHENFKSAYIEISENDIIDKKHKKVTIKDKVILKKEPS